MKSFSCSGPATQQTSYGAFRCMTFPLEKTQILPCPEVKILSFLDIILCHFFGSLQEDESLGEMNMENA